MLKYFHNKQDRFRKTKLKQIKIATMNIRLTMLITVGRHTGSSDPTILIVLVIRSGIDANRLLPNRGSFLILSKQNIFSLTKLAS